MNYLKQIPGIVGIFHQIDFKNELLGYVIVSETWLLNYFFQNIFNSFHFKLKQLIVFFGSIVSINLPDGRTCYHFYNSFDYIMVDFDTQFNSLELTPREFSLILPIVLTTSSLIHNEKFRKLNDYYKAVLNHELVSSKRDLKIEQVDSQIF